MGSIHALISSSNYKSAVIKTIKAGGCNCSRANFVGAYFAALKGIKNITDQSIVEVVTFSLPLFLIFNVNIPPTA